MSNFFTSAYNAAKSYINNVVGGAKYVASSIGNLFSGGGGSSQTANVASSSPSTITSKSTSTPQVYRVVSTPGGTMAYGVNNSNISSYSPSSGPGPTISGVSPLYAGNSPIYSSPITISPQRTGTTTSLAADGTYSSSPSSISASSIGTTTPGITVPTAPSYTNPGTVNNSGLTGLLADSYTYDPATNTYTPVQQTTTGQDQNQPNAADQRNKIQALLQKLIPQKQNVYDTPEIQAQQAEVNQRKQEVATYTAQLNNIVAQQNADLLRVRGVGAQNGVTEAVYGGQAAEINREAAIKALPVQAQVAAAQGNLQLAQDYLTQLTTWKTEQINNDYSYRVALYNSISDFVSGEEKIQLDNLKTQNDRAWQIARDNIALQDSIAKTAITNGQASLIPSITGLNPSAPDFRNQLYSLASNIKVTTAADKPTFTGQTLTLGSNEKDSQTIVSDLETSGITSSDIVQVQKYLNMGYSIDQIAKMTNMPAGIQAAFMKYITVPKNGSGLNQ